MITPSPTPAPGALPGVIPERFSIAPAPTPSFTPVPTPTPSATPTPVPRATEAPARQPLATRQPAARETPAPTAAATPFPVATSGPAPAATRGPAPIATTAPASTPPASVTAPWLWALLGAGATALAGFGAWLLLRRRRPVYDEAEESEEAAPVPEPAAVPPPPVAPPPGLAARRASTDPFEIVLNPLRIQLGEREVLLDFELLIGNATGAAAENVRLALVAISANPQQDALVAGFHRGPPGDPIGTPFDLPADGGGRMPVRLVLPRERIHVVTVGRRPMFVPMVLVDLRWRAGLGIRRFGTAFMLGAAGQGGKIGPIWLDRAAPAGPLAATRYAVKDAVAA